MTYFSSTLLLFLWDPSFYFQVSFIPRQSLSESSGITKRVRSAGGNKTVRSFENTLSLSPFFLTHTATWNIIPIPFSHSLPYFITTSRCFHAEKKEREMLWQLICSSDFNTWFLLLCVKLHFYFNPQFHQRERAQVQFLATSLAQQINIYSW